MSHVTYRMADRSDLPALCKLINEAHRADNNPEVVELQELTEDLDDAGDLTANVRVAVRDRQPVGYVRTMHFPSEELWERCYLTGDVHPDQRGQGIGRTLIAWGVERGSTLLRSSGSSLPKYLRAQVDNENTPTRRLFERLGFREVRKFEDLLRPLTDLPTAREPDGVRIEVWPDDRDDEILCVKNIAFADHWGSTPTTPSTWNTMVRGFGSIPEHSFVALDANDRVVAYSLNRRYEADDETLGRRDGWIDNLGVLPEWRGRGIASALIVRSLHAFASAGLTHASIGVDSESLTGAVRLYKSLGFELNRGGVTLEIVIEGPET